MAEPRPSIDLTELTGTARAAAGADGFAFLSPVSRQVPSGEFDPGLAPIVYVCQLTPTGCGPIVAALSIWGGTGGEAVRVTGGHYQVNWHTKYSNLVAGNQYRITVSLGLNELGSVDVLARATGRVASTTPSDLLEITAGSTVPLKFHIPKGALTTLPSTSAPLVSAARGLLTASDPVTAYRSFLASIAELYASTPIDEASRQVAIINRLAYDRRVDWGALSALSTSLRDATISFPAIEPAQTEGLSANRAPVRGPAALSDASLANSVANPADRPNTTVLFMNGMFTTAVDAAGYAAALHQVLLTRNGWRFTDPESRYRLQVALNPTGAEEESSVVCAAAEMATFGTLNDAEYTKACGASEVFEVMQEFPRVMARQPNASDPAVQSLLGKIRAERRQGRTVLIVAHSQGNMITSQALSLLTPRELSCVGVASVASPVSVFPTTDVVGLFAAGTYVADFIADNTANFFGRTASPKTQVMDAAIARLFIANPFGGISTLFDYKRMKLGFDLQLHAFTSYTDPDGLPQMLAVGLRGLDAQLAARCPTLRVSPRTLSVTVGEEQRLTAAVGTEPSLGVTWQTKNAAIATVQGIANIGVVQGIAQGSTYIVAVDPDGLRDSALVTVGPARLEFSAQTVQTTFLQNYAHPNGITYPTYLQCNVSFTMRNTGTSPITMRSLRWSLVLVDGDVHYAAPEFDPAGWYGFPGALAVGESRTFVIGEPFWIGSGPTRPSFRIPILLGFSASGSDQVQYLEAQPSCL